MAVPPGPAAISGPFARLLSSAVDLGPSAQIVQVTVADGLSWSVMRGPAADMSTRLRVPIHDYRLPDGTVFYASPQQPALPGAGRVLGYTPFHESMPLPRDVPGGSLSPDAASTAYNLKPLRTNGFDGTGETVAVFAFGDFSQSDLDDYSSRFGLPRVVPEVVGEPLPGNISGETTLDLEVVHGLAPQARLVVVNARPTASGDGTYVKIADLMNETDRRFPGAVWSLSIGWGCDRLVTANDVAPVRAALTKAHSHQSAVFDASGDTAGMGCRNGQSWSNPPGADDIGLDAVASLPEITSVGGTRLSTDAGGQWNGETAWFSSVLTLGSGGGEAKELNRPPWQVTAAPPRDSWRRLVPDVAAVADTGTGVAMVQGGRLLTGGGTSVAAPLWAGITAVLNQYLLHNGGHRLGDLNPLLYQIAAGARLPAFHDITKGANAVASAGPGYDMVTGLGSPNVDNLAHDLLDLQTGLR